ncbi:MAG TPA: carbohydrate ABC transporter permease [Rhodopila sp.]|nr:carbohydrate ABC transporter permease [Rhodopila sp.]
MADRWRTPGGAERGLVSRFAGLALVHLVLIAGSLVMLVPFVWMLLTSVTPAADIFEPELHILPRHFAGWENYGFALEHAPLLRFALNGLIVCLGILACQIVTAVPCAYALAKLRFPGRSVLFVLVLVGLCIPIQVPALPLYIALAKLNLLNTYFALMCPYVLSAFAIFLFRQSFKSFPDNIIQAARLDGFSEFEIVWRIVVPSAWPAISAFAVFSFVAHWNDLYWPLIVITDTNLATPPLGMMLFASAESGTNYGALSAAATMSTAPLVVAFLFARRTFVGGIAISGMK